MRKTDVKTSIWKQKAKYKKTPVILFFNKDYTNNYRNKHAPSKLGRYMSNSLPNLSWMVRHTRITESSEIPLFQKI